MSQSTFDIGRIVAYGSMGSFAPASETARSWRDDAKCLGAAFGEELNPWFKENATRTEAALLCAGCPVKAECVEDAVSFGGYGIRGGLTEAGWRR